MITRNLAQLPFTQTGFLTWKDSSRSYNIELGDFLTLGRDSENHITLSDEFASSRHARVERRGGGFLLRDLRSRNGTQLNGARVFEAQLSDGDRIRIGQTEIQFNVHRAENAPGVLTSKNPNWNAQLEKIPNIARSPFPVLLTGPSGTVKTCSRNLFTP